MLLTFQTKSNRRSLRGSKLCLSHILRGAITSPSFQMSTGTYETNIFANLCSLYSAYLFKGWQKWRRFGHCSGFFGFSVQVGSAKNWVKGGEGKSLLGVLNIVLAGHNSCRISTYCATHQHFLAQGKLSKKTVFRSEFIIF